MQTNQPRANELLNFIRYQHAGVRSDDEQRMDEINELLTYSKELEATETKKAKINRNVFVGMGLGLLGASAMALFANIIGDVEPILAFGAVLLFAASVFTLGRLQSNPLEKLRERMEKLHARLVKPLPKSRPKGIFKSRKDKIIAGVASGLARRLGVQPGLIRLLFLALIPFSGGAAIGIYLLLALGLSFVPEEREEV